MIKAIIFDCFGVVRDDPSKVTYEFFGGDWEKDKEELLELFYKSDKGYIKSTAPFVAERLGIDVDVWRNALQTASGINEELLKYILELKKTYKVAMLSNVGPGGLERWFDAGFLDIYFEVQVASGDIGFAKPEPEAYEIAADRLGVRLDECVFTDDRPGYVEGAQAVGMKTILFTSTEQFKKELTKILKTY